MVKNGTCTLQESTLQEKTLHEDILQEDILHEDIRHEDIIHEDFLRDNWAYWSAPYIHDHRVLATLSNSLQRPINIHTKIIQQTYQTHTKAPTIKHPSKLKQTSDQTPTKVVPKIISYKFLYQN